MFERITTGVALFSMSVAATAAPPSEFTVRSADGTEITGQVDGPMQTPRVAVLMVPGTGVWDRDVRFGQGERSLVFKDLAQRMAARGLAVVRTDTRGVSAGATGPDAVSFAALAGRTTTTMRDDLAAAYDWARSSSGLGARCVILLAHSEGMHHVGRLAELGAPPPLAVIGIGADMEAPAVGFRWRMAERDAVSLEQMDADDDGRITDAEVREGWSRTPAAVNGTIAPYLHPSGAWSDADLTRLRDLLHWGGRLYINGAWYLLVCNAVFIGGMAALVALTVLAVYRAVRPRNPEGARPSVRVSQSA